MPANIRTPATRTWVASGANPVRLSYHWADSTGKVLLHDGERTALPADLAAGDQVTVQATVKAPATAGTYELQWDLVEENSPGSPPRAPP